MKHKKKGRWVAVVSIFLMISVGASACPFGDGILTLRRKDGRQFVLSLATDSCEVFRVNGVYYDYAAVHNGEENDLRNAKALMRIFCGIPWNW